MKRPTGSDIDLKAVKRETGFGWCWFASLGLGSSPWAYVTLGLSQATISTFPDTSFPLLPFPNWS